MNSSLMANIMGIEQWMLILGVVVLLFGGQKIPELMRGIGKGVGELQKGLEDGKRMLHDSVHAETTEVRPADTSIATAEVKKTEEASPTEHAVPRA